MEYITRKIKVYDVAVVYYDPEQKAEVTDTITTPKKAYADITNRKAGNLLKDVTGREYPVIKAAVVEKEQEYKLPVLDFIRAAEDWRKNYGR